MTFPILFGSVNAQRKYSTVIKRMFGANLLAYWPLWEASGAVAYDISGNARNGTVTGATPAGGPGIGDGHTAFGFDGNDYIQATIPTLTQFSIFGWIAPTGWGGGSYNETVLSFGEGAFLYIHSITHKADCQIYTGSVYRNPIGPVGVATLNQFNFLASTYDGTNGITYLGATGGTPVTVAQLNSGHSTTATMGSFAAQYLTGGLAHVGLLNRAATPAEVGQLANFFL